MTPEKHNATMTVMLILALLLSVGAVVLALMTVLNR